MMIRAVWFVVGLSFAGGVAWGQYAYIADLSGLHPARTDLVRFDLSDPGTVETVAVLPAGNVKGLVMTGEDEGWFVSVGSHPARNGGLWRYEDGVSTLVSDFGFGSVGWGGMTPRADGSGLLLAMNDVSGGSPVSTLYSLGFDGALSAIGSLRHPDGDLEEFNGLATDPATGRILGIAANNNTAGGELYEIDPGTGVVSLVGGTGTLVFATGGLDFTRDGRLYSVQGLFPNELSRLDPMTGAATELGAVAGINVAGSIAFVVPSPGVLGVAVFGLCALGGPRR